MSPQSKDAGDYDEDIAPRSTKSSGSIFFHLNVRMNFIFCAMCVIFDQFIGVQLVQSERRMLMVLVS